MFPHEEFSGGGLLMARSFGRRNSCRARERICSPYRKVHFRVREESSGW